MSKGQLCNCGGVIRDARVIVAFIDEPSQEHVALACNGKCGKVLLLKGIRPTVDQVKRDRGI